MKVYIIGNGFDQGHDLPTSYWDFRSYLERLYPDFLYQFEEHYQIYPDMSEDSKQTLLWNRLESNLANIDEDVIIEQASSFEMGLESGDVGIEDTLYAFFSDEYHYIMKLAKYLKHWIRTIRIRDLTKKTSLISNQEDAYYVTFNYTAVLERVYEILPEKVIHIHGSLRDYDDDPILGHGNIVRIENIKKQRQAAEDAFDEKEVSICRVVEDYYKRTYKEISRYFYKLGALAGKNIDSIIVIGHSVDGVDMPYFTWIDRLSGEKAFWKVYFYSNEEENSIKERLIKCGIDEGRIIMCKSDAFYDL